MTVAQEKIREHGSQEWDNVEIFPSSDQSVKKFVFTNEPGTERQPAVAEAVMYQYPTYKERTVICCSTMSGCPVGCRFCGTGDSFVRNLSAEEIVDQVVTCLEAERVDTALVEKLQFMFMSMGEPMLNQRPLMEAILRLNADYPNAALLVSTSAPRVDYALFRALSADIPNVGLQFSVHRTTDESRDQLIPFKQKLSLVEIAREGELWYEATGRQPFFNYCVDGTNNSPEDVERLAELFDVAIWQATVSVVCEPDESIAAANQRQRELVDNFMPQLIEKGFSVRMFDPAGQDDIGGGCGQLWYVQEWMRDNPKFAHPSIGNRLNLPRMHAPRIEE